MTSDGTAGIWECVWVCMCVCVWGGLLHVPSHTRNPNIQARRRRLKCTELPLRTPENRLSEKLIYSPAKAIITYLHDSKRVITESPRLGELCSHSSWNEGCCRNGEEMRGCRRRGGMTLWRSDKHMISKASCIIDKGDVSCGGSSLAAIISGNIWHVVARRHRFLTPPKHSCLSRSTSSIGSSQDRGKKKNRCYFCSLIV